MRITLPKPTLYSILFSLLFLPIRIKFGYILTNTNEILQNSHIMVNKVLTPAKGLFFSIPITDIAIIFFLFIILKSKKIKLEKNELIPVLFIFLTTITFTFFNPLTVKKNIISL